MMLAASGTYAGWDLGGSPGVAAGGTDLRLELNRSISGPNASRNRLVESVRLSRSDLLPQKQGLLILRNKNAGPI